MSISRSLLIVEPDVVSMSPVMVALAPPLNAASPLPSMSFTWNEIKNREDVKAMPVYPDDGYIRKIGNAMVVKLS